MSWQRVKGHEALVAAFGRAVARGRLAHAYLFTGPPGIGKRLFARELAKSLLCESPPAGQFDSCDRCPACKQVDAGTHPDLFMVARPEDKQEMPIEVVRRLTADLAMKPARGDRKIAILDDADDLNEESANCFLKTLEEPPPGSLLILIGTAADLQLSTIRSRCQLIPFAPLTEPIVRDLLKDADIEPAAVERLAHLSDGSPGLARELTVPGLWEYRQKLLAALAVPSPDSPALAKELIDLVEEVGKDSGAQRRRAALVVRLLVDALRQALSVSVDNSLSTKDPAEAKILFGLSQKFGPDGLIRRLDRCLTAATEIDRRVQLVLVIEGLVDALAYG